VRRKRRRVPFRFARTPDVSPDGRWVAFSYLGDIWIVSAEGGVARQITTHEAHEINPVFSPDGRWLAFSSNRYGSYDVFVVSVEGGPPGDSPSIPQTNWSTTGRRMGRYILFSTRRTPQFPPLPEMYLCRSKVAANADSRSTKAATASFARTVWNSLTSAGPDYGIAKDIEARPTMTSGFAAPMARIIAG
jgi:tricorn protease